MVMQAEGKVSPSVASALLTRLEDQSATEQDRVVAKQLPSNMYVL